jgi:hypothetical protein
MIVTGGSQRAIAVTGMRKDIHPTIAKEIDQKKPLFKKPLVSIFLPPIPWPAFLENYISVYLKKVA